MSELTSSKISEKHEKFSLEKRKERFGTRHLQVVLMSSSLMIGYAMNLSLPVAVIAMTDFKAENSNFKYYEWSTSERSLILSSFMWGYAAFQIPCGYLAKIWSAHKLLSLGLFISSIVNLSLPFLTYYGGWIFLCVGRALIGVCHSCFSSCTHTLLSKWAPPVERSRLCTCVGTGSILGAILAMSLSGLIASSSLGWPGIFFIFGVLGVLSSIILFFYASDSPSSHKKICPIEKEFILNSFQQIKNHCEVDNRNPPWKNILISVPVWALIITECGSNWGTFTINTEMTLYMKNILNYNIAANGLVSTLPYLANWLLSFFFSCISDYANRKNVSVSKIRRVSNTVGMWGPALALVALCHISTDNKTWPVLLLVLAVGLKAGTASGYIVNQIDLSPNYAGNIYSITTCIGAVVSILAPIVSGKIVQDVTDATQWHLVFYITAFAYFFTNLVFIIFGRGKIRSWNNPDNKTLINTIYDLKTIIATP